MNEEEIRQVAATVNELFDWGEPIEDSWFWAQFHMTPPNPNTLYVTGKQRVRHFNGLLRRVKREVLQTYHKMILWDANIGYHIAQPDVQIEVSWRNAIARIESALRYGMNHQTFVNEALITDEGQERRQVITNALERMMRSTHRTRAELHI
jgi:hypothetical protein